MPTPRDVHRGTTRLLSTVLIGLGIAMIVVALAHGGGVLARGVLLGVLFAAAGAARLYLSTRVG